jgi:Pyridoxamine 5'-phosphate oxidase
MGSWETFDEEAPELAAFVREQLSGPVAYLGTLRADGAPRVNPVSPWFATGRMFIRMYPGSVKVRSLERDARYALHSAVPDDLGTGGEVVVWGTASVVEDAELLAAANSAKSEPGRYVVLEFDLDEVLVTVYEGDATSRQHWP